MNKLLWLLLLIIWIIFGAWCCDQKLGANSSSGNDCSTWKIVDGNFESTAKGNVQFKENSAEVILDAEGVKKSLEDVANHLKSSKNNLTIVGYYNNNELSKNSKIGMSRAANLKKYLVENLGAKDSKININSVEFNENCYNGGKLERGVRFMFRS